MLGGDPAVDLVNTVSDWETDPADRLGGPEAFADWAEAAGLADAGDAARMKREIRREPEAAAKIYRNASELRSAAWTIFSAIARGRAPARAQIAIVDRLSRRATEHSELVPGKGGFRREATSETSGLERVVLKLAQVAENLLVNGPLDRLHFCGGPGCGWMFVDRSKNGMRRWCSMAACGNAAKVNKFRKRMKEEAT